MLEWNWRGIFNFFYAFLLRTKAPRSNAPTAHLSAGRKDHALVTNGSMNNILDFLCRQTAHQKASCSSSRGLADKIGVQSLGARQHRHRAGVDVQAQHILDIFFASQTETDHSSISMYVLHLGKKFFFGIWSRKIFRTRQSHRAVFVHSTIANFIAGTHSSDQKTDFHNRQNQCRICFQGKS